MEYKKIRPKKRKFKTNKVLYIFLLFLFIGIGYAALTTSLSINGTTNVATNSWNIHFANLHVQSGSVEGNAPTVSSNSISYAATLAQPGDFYEFSVDIKNDGTLPGKISLVNLTGNNTNYLNTSYAYSNGDAITIGDIINAGKSKRITVKAWIPSDIDTSLLPTVDTPITLTFNLQYVQSEQDLALDATDQLIALADSNECMYKYEGQVTDKVGVTEQATQVYFDRCTDKRNVIFNNMCWQIVRTTETGGIKMIYNGEPEGSKCLNTRGDHTGFVSTPGSQKMINSDYLYGSSFTYNKTTGEFTLIDTRVISPSPSSYKEMMGMFTCLSASDTCTTMYEINIHYASSIVYAAEYEIGNTNYAQIGDSPYNAYYTSPTLVGYMFNDVIDIELFTSPTSGSLMGNDVSYENGVYTLLPADGETELGTTLDDTHHYTCNNTVGTCSRVRFYFDSYNDYIVLEGSANIEEEINKMLYDDNINKYNSSIKGIVDAWYAQNLSSKTNMLENTLFCNARNLSNQSTNGWNKNGSLNVDLEFKNSSSSTNMTCINETDQFSTSNPKAKLTYPVGLIQDEERTNISPSSLLGTGDYWHTISPGSYKQDKAYMRTVLNAGGIYSRSVSIDTGIRPVISLAPGNTFASGTGSESDPWIIQE